MGLTVHFKLTACDTVNTARAKQIVTSLQHVAENFQREGFVDKVLPVTSDPNLLRRYACDWLILPVPGEDNTSTGAEIMPLAGFIFPVNVGKDCEPLWLGLCRYPSTVRFHGKDLQTKKGAGWCFSGFCKTQFASLHGWEHFQRCHCAVVNLLAACRTAGLRVKISDEGNYWPRRSLKNLRRKLDEMNGLVAAMAGALKDGCENPDGKSGVESPIFGHKHFERLEAEGAPRVAPAINKLRGLLKKT
jgi:hypothetical protein